MKVMTKITYKKRVCQARNAAKLPDQRNIERIPIFSIFGLVAARFRDSVNFPPLNRSKTKMEIKMDAVY